MKLIFVFLYTNKLRNSRQYEDIHAPQTWKVNSNSNVLTLVYYKDQNVWGQQNNSCIIYTQKHEKKKLCQRNYAKYWLF